MSQIMNPPPLEVSEIPSIDKEGKVSTTITAKPTSLKPTVRFLVHFGEMGVAMLGVMLFRWSDYAGGSAPVLNKVLLALAVLLCVGVLSAFTGTLPPIRAGHAHPFATTVKTTDGKFAVKLNVSPNQRGTNVFTVTVLDATTR